MIPAVVLKIFKFQWKGFWIKSAGFFENFLRKICIKLEPTILQHSFWALWTRIFKPNNLLYYYLALKLTLECDLDGLENGASKNHVMIIPGVNK